MAALEGAGLSISYDLLLSTWPGLIAATTCPKCDDECPSIAGAVIHLNDVHYEPRERIADWLEQQGL